MSWVCELTEDACVGIHAQTKKFDVDILLQLAELVSADSELLEDSVKQRRPDLAATMVRNSDVTAIRMRPTLVTSRLALAFKSKSHGNAAKLLRTATRHARSRSCPPASRALSPDIRLQSSRTPVRARPTLLLLSPLTHSNPERREFQPPTLPVDSYIGLPCNHRGSCLS